MHSIEDDGTWEVRYCKVRYCKSWCISLGVCANGGRCE